MKWLLAIGALVALVALVWKFGYPDQKFRYRITVEIDTPEGVRSGSSVWEAHIVRYPAMMGDTGVHWRGAGDAVAVDLPNGKKIFAPLDVGGANLVPLPERAAGFPQVPTGSLWPELRRRNEQIDLHGRQNLPWLVAFEDVARPETAYRIEPGQLTERFGSGYGLRRVFLEPTDEPIGRNIEEWLPWVPHYLNKRLQLSGTQPLSGDERLAEFLSAANFRKVDR